MIVDASIAVKRLIEEEDCRAARDLLDRVDLIAPTLIHSEVGNAIWKKRRRGEFGNDGGLTALPDLLATLVQTIDATPMIARALAIAASLDHPIYDCVDLAVAEALDSELVTADERFVRKAASTFANRVGFWHDRDRRLPVRPRSLRRRD